MIRAVLVVYGPAVASADAAVSRLREGGIVVKQQLRVRFEESDVERLVDLSDWAEEPVESAPQPLPSPVAKGKAKPAAAPAGKPAPPKAAKASPRPSFRQESARALLPEEARAELAEALTRAESLVLIVSCAAPENLYPTLLPQVVGAVSDAGKESRSLRGELGASPSLCGVLRTKDVASASEHVRLVLAAIARRRDVAAAGEAHVHHGSQWVAADEILQFAFPPGQLHPRSTGRLFVYATCGPLDEHGRLRGGVRGRHVVTDKEVTTMVRCLEEEDVLRVFGVQMGRSDGGGSGAAAAEGPAAGYSDSVRELMIEGGAVVREYTAMSREEVLAALRPARRDPHGSLLFHDVQRLLLQLRDQRVRDLQVMFPALAGSARVRAAAEGKGAPRRAEVGATQLLREIRSHRPADR